MIVSASRRTDLPACYSEWLLRRLASGFALTRNPMNPAQVRRVSLIPRDVDAIVFWSKNPAPLLGHLGFLSAWRSVFQFTLTGYGQDVEPGLPPKSEITEAFLRLADAFGPRRVLWRYDPIFLSAAYPPERHVDLFARLAEALRGHTERCTISFIDPCRSLSANAGRLGLLPMDDGAKESLARQLAAIARGAGMELVTCAEEIDLAAAGIGHGRCIDPVLLNGLFGLDLPLKKDRNQRPACGCAPSVDIGAYNTCPAGCFYCYANYDSELLKCRAAAHDPDSPELIHYNSRMNVYNMEG